MGHSASCSILNIILAIFVHQIEQLIIALVKGIGIVLAGKGQGVSTQARALIGVNRNLNIAGILGSADGSTHILSKDNDVPLFANGNINLIGHARNELAIDSN